MCTKMYEGMGIKLLNSGVNTSAWIMLAKMECVMECNSGNLPYNHCKMNTAPNHLGFSWYFSY